MSLSLIATCGIGLEPFLADELAELAAVGNITGIDQQVGAVAFTGDWKDCWRANLRLRTANRVVIELGRWTATDGDQLHAGARNLVRRRRRQGLDPGRLLSPHKTLAVRATSTGSRVTDTRWIALRVKDGLVDGQRDRHGQRASVDRQDPDLSLRLRLHRNEATLLLDTSGESLDRRGYRVQTVDAPVRENLAAACVLASGWPGGGPVLDPMCGSGTLLIEAALWAAGRRPAVGDRAYAFERLPSFDAAAFDLVRAESLPSLPGGAPRLIGVDRSPSAIRAARRNLERAGLAEHAMLEHGEAFSFEPPKVTPEAPGLLLVNPPYGERIGGDVDAWRKLGDLFKQRYAGWTAVVLAGGEDRGKHIGLRPRRRYPVKNGPIDARILVFDLY